MIKSPLYKSRKAIVAVITLALNGIVVLATERANRPDLQAFGLQVVTLLGSILIAALGLAGAGKEAARITAEAETVVVPDDDEEVDE